MGKLDDESPKAPVRITKPVGDAPAPPAANLMADVIGVEIHLNIFILTGNLPGVSKALFTMGKITPEFIAAIKTFQKKIVGLSNPDGRVDPNGKTLKFLNGPISARAGAVDPGKLTPPPDVARARKAIAAIARTLLREGGHFLNGSQGDMPGRANGHPVRPAVTFPAIFLKEGDPRKLGPAVNAAWIGSTRFVALGCMGRPATRKIGSSAFRAGDPRLTALQGYIDCIERMYDAGILSSKWPGFNHYRADPAKFDRASSYDELLAVSPADAAKGHFPRRINPGGLVHLGETCTGIRHFDCIGFVNFTLSKVLGSKWSFGMDWYRDPSATGRPFSTTKLGAGDVFSLAGEGDLVFKGEGSDHCGICTLRNGEVVVTNCRSMEDGLIDSTLEDEWDFHCRLVRV